MRKDGYPYVREMIHEAVEALGSPTTNAEICDWILARYPGTLRDSIQVGIEVCTVNRPTRVQLPENERPRPATDDRYDFLFAPERGVVEWYHPSTHGAWSIAEDAEGYLGITVNGGPIIYPPTPPRSPDSKRAGDP